jgi:hypothetical protein
LGGGTYLYIADIFTNIYRGKYVIYFAPIGYVRHRYPDDEVKKRLFVDAAVEVLPEYEEGLRGLGSATLSSWRIYTSPGAGLS